MSSEPEGWRSAEEAALLEEIEEDESSLIKIDQTLEEYADQISNLQQKIAWSECSRSQIELVIKEKKGMLRDSICKISPEILAQIFLWTCDDVSLQDARAVVFDDRDLMLVCKRWYNTARSTPQLWNTLKYYSWKRKAPDFIIKHWWKNLSGGCPLHLMLRVTTANDGLQPMWESVVRPNLHRLKRVFLSLDRKDSNNLSPDTRQILNEIWADLSNSLTLTHIVLNRYPIPQIENADNVSPTVFDASAKPRASCAPNLQYLAVYRQTIPHMRSNTLLHLHVRSKGLVHFNQLWNLMMGCPNLKTLALWTHYFIDFPSSPETFALEEPFPNFETLNLITGDDVEYAPEAFHLIYLRSHKLRSFSVSGTDRELGPSLPIPPVVYGHLTSVEIEISLTRWANRPWDSQEKMDYHFDWANDTVIWLEHAPNLERLTMNSQGSRWTPQIFELLIQSFLIGTDGKTADMLCPHLTELEFGGFNMTVPSLLRRVVEQRAILRGSSEEQASIGANGSSLPRRLVKVTVDLNFPAASNDKFCLSEASSHEFLRKLDQAAMGVEEGLLPYQVDAIAKIPDRYRRLKYAFRQLVHRPGDWALFPWREGR